MRKSLYIMIVFAIINSVSYSQRADSLIQIYIGLGDTLDYVERTYFGFFTSIKGFQHAVFYNRNEQYLVTKISYLEYGTSNDTTIIQNLTALDSLQLIIRDIESRGNELYSDLKEIRIVTKSGESIVCQLEMFDSKYVYVIPANSSSKYSETLRYRISSSSIDVLVLEGESNTLLYTCAGGGIGTAIGTIVAVGIYERQNDFGDAVGETFTSGAVLALFAILGVVAGLVVGIKASTDDEPIYFDTESDILKLRGHAAFNLLNLPDKNYLELE